MAQNIGRFDQILRIGIGISLIYIGFIDKDIINDTLSSYIIGLLGLMNLIFALIRYCPLYTVTNISTYLIKSNKANKLD